MRKSVKISQKTKRATEPPAASAVMDVTKSETPPPKVRSEGQRLLLLVPGSLAQIAKSVGGGSPQNVLDWRNGKKVPGVEMRARLYGAYAISALAWSQPPSEQGKSASSAVATNNPQPPPLPLESLTTLDACLQLLTRIRHEANRNLLPAERVKLADTEAKILALRHRLEREHELTEDRIIREHPKWQAIKRVWTAALIPYPAAAKAVADALASVGNL
jgi:hypothetical protein